MNDNVTLRLSLYLDSSLSLSLTHTHTSRSKTTIITRPRPRPHDNQLTYTGDKTKILAVECTIKFPTLVSRVSALSDSDVSFKYQLPGEDLDSLISVTNSTQFVFNLTEQYQDLTDALQNLDFDRKMTQANDKSFIVSNFRLNRSRRLTLDNDGNLRIYSFDSSIADWTVV